MVIRHMNRMLEKQGRLVFAVITLFIILAFVGFMTPGFFSALNPNAGGDNEVIGKAMGEDITRGQYRDSAENLMVSYSLLSGLRNPLNYSDYAAKNIFSEICWTRAALKCGVRVSQEEIAKYIKDIIFFQGKDGFDLKKYQDYVNNTLGKNGYGEQNVEEAARMVLLKRKIEKQIKDDVIVTPGEVKAYYMMKYEKIDAMKAQFSGKDYLKQVKVTDKDLETYFKANKKNYVIPARFKILTVKFPYKNYLVAAEKSVNDAALKKFYEDNKSKFMTTPEKGKKTEELPFAKAKAQVKKQYIDVLSKKEAMRAGQIFAQGAFRNCVDLDDEQKEKADVAGLFKKYCEEQKKQTKASSWFTSKATAIPGIGGNQAMIQTIARSVYPISSAVAGKDAVFVAFITDKEAERQAKLAEVKQQVRKDYLETKSVSLARKAARETALQLSKAKNLEAAVKALKGKVKFEQLDTFLPNSRSPLPGLEGYIASQLAKTTPAGKLSNIQSMQDGAIIVYVQKRVAPDMKEFKKADVKKLELEYRYYKQRTAEQTFFQWMMSQSGMIQSQQAQNKRNAKR